MIGNVQRGTDVAFGIAFGIQDQFAQTMNPDGVKHSLILGVHFYTSPNRLHPRLVNYMNLYSLRLGQQRCWAEYLTSII